MILDAEHGPKSPILLRPDSGTQSPAPPTHSSFFQHHVSYSTFPASNLHVNAQYANTVSDITALLGYHSPEPHSNGEQPPAYDEVSPSRKVGNRFWTRYAAIVLTLFLVYSSSFSFQLIRELRSTPNLPEHGQSPPDSPPPQPLPTQAAPTPPSQPPPNLPGRPPLLPLPPYGPLPIPDLPYVPPNVGRTDLCRPWAYSPNTAARPSNSDQQLMSRLVYTIPSLAPIHIETSVVCARSGASNGPCTEQDDSSDAFSGKLQVVGGDIDLPKVELLLQHGSFLGLEDVSVCLMQRPLMISEHAAGGGGYKWVLGIYIWKDPTSSTRHNRLASASIIVTLPYHYVHDFTTQLDHFSQTIGSAKRVVSRLLSFGMLQLAGNHGGIEVWNIDAATIKGTSKDTPLLVADSRVSRLLDLRSIYGIVSCNVTLVQIEGGPLTQANLQSSAGVVDRVVDLEYPLFPTTAPRFDVTAYSRFSRTTLWMTDQQGTKALRVNPTPSILPAISVNLTSEFAIAQAMIPATYHGSVDLRSQYARTGAIDHASHLPGRAVEWSDRGQSATRGNVRWVGARREDEGRIHVSTEFATARLLFLGLDDGSLGDWPKESSGMEFERDNVIGSLIK